MLKRTLTLSLAALAAVVLTSAEASGQDNPRFGVWKLRSDAPPPQVNIMTYEPYMGTGMRITVASTNARGQSNEWGYATMFDGKFLAVAGQENSETAVEIINETTTRISNRRNGRVYQVIINTLSDDGNSISNEYVRLDENGKITRVTHAIYDRQR
jgi:hypothetical protein